MEPNVFHGIRSSRQRWIGVGQPSSGGGRQPVQRWRARWS